MKKSFIFMLLMGLLVFPAVGQAKAFLREVEGFVVKVSDGDTINVQDERGNKLKIRLYGIDAPETEKSSKKTGHVSKPGQPYGEEAFRALEGLIYHQNVKVDVIDRDRYQRLVALVWRAGININEEMVAEGYAWAYRQYLHTPYASEFIRSEEHAREKRLGLWSRNNPQPPWEFRRILKRDQQIRGNTKENRLHS